MLRKPDPLISFFSSPTSARGSGVRPPPTSILRVMETKVLPISLLLLDGVANGRIKATRSLANCIVFLIPRDSFETCRLEAASEDGAIPEINNSGVYILLGEDAASGEKLAYVGQASSRTTGESVLARFYAHSRDPRKNFAKELLFITTDRDELGLTQLSWLENHFCRAVVKGGGRRLTNDREPRPGPLKLQDRLVLNDFVEIAKTLVDVLVPGLLPPGPAPKWVKPLPEPMPMPLPQPKPVPKKRSRRTKQGAAAHEKTKDCIHFVLTRKIRETGQVLKASAECSNGAFVLKAGSLVWTRPRAQKFGERRCLRKKEDVRRGVLVQVDGDVYRTTMDLVFTSPSLAGDYVVNGSLNGRTEWLAEDGRSYAEVFPENEVSAEN